MATTWRRRRVSRWWWWHTGADIVVRDGMPSDVLTREGDGAVLVVVVRAAGDTAASRIVVGVDGSGNSMEPLEFALGLAAELEEVSGHPFHALIEASRSAALLVVGARSPWSAALDSVHGVPGGDPAAAG